MSNNCPSNTIPQFTVLSEGQKEKIHLATLDILQKTGVKVLCREAVELLAGAGCGVCDGDLVRIPRDLIEWAIRTAPSSITIYDRSGSEAMYLEGSNTYFGTGSDLPTTIDLYTGERRMSSKQDIANAARLVDALPNISFNMSMALPWDVPIAVSDVHSFEAMVVNSIKPIVYTAHDKQGLADILEIAGIVAGGLDLLRKKPFLVLYAQASTPLQHGPESTEKLLLIAENKLPVAYTSGIVSGAVSPVTMAGSIVLANAEHLSGLLIAQLKQPGTPFIFGAGTAPLDMKTTVASYAAPEHMIATAALVELGRYYRLPTWGYGGDSDSKLFDEQASAEGALWSLITVLNGANLAHDTGYVESGLTCSLEMLVTMDEIIGMVRRMMDGIEISDETLALDLIDKVGPGGNYLSTEHTLKHYKENWYPGLFDRRNYSEWAESGKKTLSDKANERARELMETHRPLELPIKIREEVAAVIDRSEERIDSGT